MEINPIPIRVQRSRKKKQVSPNGLPIKYVGRPTAWGNPFKDDGDKVVVRHKKSWAIYHLKKYKDKSAVELFEDMCNDLNSHPVEESVRLHFQHIKDNISELKGFNLSCWCNYKCRCHADKLLSLVNKISTKHIVQTKITDGSIVSINTDDLSLCLADNEMYNFKTLAIFHVK